MTSTERCRLCEFEILEGEYTDSGAHRVCLLVASGENRTTLVSDTRLLSEEERKFDLDRLLNQYVATNGPIRNSMFTAPSFRSEFDHYDEWS